MKQILTELPNFKEITKDYDIVDCSIRNPDTFYLLTRGQEPEHMTGENSYLFDDTEVSYRLLGYMRTEPVDEQLYIAEKITGFNFPEIEMTYTPLEQVIIYDGWDEYIASGSGCSEFEKTVDVKGTIKANCICGKVYFPQNRRSVKYRIDEEEWTQIGDNDISFEYDFSDESQMKKGFYAVDGFDETNIYAVGGKGDVWRCINNEWIQCDFPTDLGIKTVCCAGDGNVYISGTDGITYYGKEDNWTKVEGDEISIPFDDIVWHDGKIWCSNDYGLWWIVDGKMIEADVPSEVKICSRSLCARFGELLVAGMGGAALHEDGEWKLLYNQIFLP